MRATLRFYAELKDFLPSGAPSGTVVRHFDLPGSVKDLIEACGVPHTEVDLVLVDGEPVDFSHRVSDGDRIAVFPVFEAFDISSVQRVRPEPLRTPRFVADVHLGRLARYLRLLGFDVSYAPHRSDPELVETSVGEHRVLLTRDVELLKHGSVTHGYYVRGTDPRRQLAEVVERFDLAEMVDPFTRCMACNGRLAAVPKSDVEQRLPDHTRRHFDEFWLCEDCGRVYWEGAHLAGLTEIIEDVR